MDRVIYILISKLGNLAQSIIFIPLITILIKLYPVSLKESVIALFLGVHVLRITLMMSAAH